jgi:RND family efflux transporter MFP subunit
VLAEVDAALANRELQLERSRLGVVEARLTQARAAVTIAERELERMRALVASGVRTETELLELSDALTRAEAARDVVDAERTQQQRAVERAQTERGRYTVVAPFDGIVTAREVSVGQTVSAQAPILTLVSPASLRLAVEVPESALASITPSQPARVSLDAVGGEALSATVDRIVPAVNVASRTVQVELAVDAPSAALREGMFGRGAFVLERVVDALLVPIPSVHTDRETGETVVWVVDEDGLATPTPVVERMRDERNVALEGIDEGATVITSPVERLSPGGAVIVVNR